MRAHQGRGFEHLAFLVASVSLVAGLAYYYSLDFIFLVLIHAFHALEGCGFRLPKDGPHLNNRSKVMDVLVRGNFLLWRLIATLTKKGHGYA